MTRPRGTTGRRRESISKSAAKEWLGNRGYDPAFGARPLKRLIQKEVLDTLARKVISGEVKEGETVVVDTKDGALVFKPSLSGAPLVA